MPKFTIGQDVICVESVKCLTKGKIYKIKDIETVSMPPSPYNREKQFIVSVIDDENEEDWFHENAFGDIFVGDNDHEHDDRIL